MHVVVVMERVKHVSGWLGIDRDLCYDCHLGRRRRHVRHSLEWQ
jgi:hypothetical protein